MIWVIFGLGIDIVSLKRIAETDLQKLIGRILTEREQGYLPELQLKRLETLAGRFAAKEAISKALGTGIGKRCSFLDIEVINDKSGVPQATLSSKATQIINRDFKIHLALSHEREYAVATAVIELI